MSLLVALVAGYLIGGVPTGILISRAVAGVDPRTLGSGSSGATNVSRAIGKKWAVTVLLLDILKGFLPVFFLAPLLGSTAAVELTRVLMALGVVAGHVWTPYASFRGGKGVAAGAGALLALDPIALLTALAAWLVIFGLFRRVSLASLIAAVAAPLAMVALGGRPKELVAGAILIALFLVFTHRENIARLMTGRERPVA